MVWPILILEGVNLGLEGFNRMVRIQYSVAAQLSQLSMTLGVTRISAQSDIYSRQIRSMYLYLLFLTYISLPELLIAAYYDEIRTDPILSWWFTNDPYLSHLLTSYSESIAAEEEPIDLFAWLGDFLIGSPLDYFIPLLETFVIEPGTYVAEFFAHVPNILAMDGHHAEQEITAFIQSYDHKRPNLRIPHAIDDYIQILCPILPFFWSAIKGHIHSFAYYNRQSSDPYIPPPIDQFTKTCTATLSLDGQTYATQPYNHPDKARFRVPKQYLEDHGIMKACINICNLEACANISHLMGSQTLMAYDETWTIEWPFELRGPGVPLPEDCMDPYLYVHKPLWVESQRCTGATAKTTLNFTGAYNRLECWVGVYGTDLPSAGGIRIYVAGNQVWHATEADFSRLHGPHCLHVDVPFPDSKHITNPQVIIQRYHTCVFGGHFDVYVGPVTCYNV